MNTEKINYLTKQFFVNSNVLNFDTITSGCINKTYIVEHQYNQKTSKFILQKLSNIFQSHEIINVNHKLITDHIINKINNNFYSNFTNAFNKIRWEVPNLIKCKSNNLFLFPFDSNLWRAMVYIDNTFCSDFLEDEKMAYETGIGLAKFHLMCSDINSCKLKQSLINFHNTNYYLDQYIVAIKEYNFKDLYEIENKRIRRLIDNLSKHFKYVRLLYNYLENTQIVDNVIHGDPKLTNFLFDVEHKNVVSLIDLDTVSYGNLLVDLADCIRSICNPLGEDPIDKEKVFFDINFFMYFLQGYFSIPNSKKNSFFSFLPEYIYLIIFELTIRFFTDFLRSNRHFKIKYETHNLFRAEVQNRLLSSFLSQAPNLKDKLHEIGIYSRSSFFSDVQKIV